METVKNSYRMTSWTNLWWLAVLDRNRWHRLHALGLPFLLSAMQVNGLFYHFERQHDLRLGDNFTLGIVGDQLLSPAHIGIVHVLQKKDQKHGVV